MENNMTHFHGWCHYLLIWLHLINLKIFSASVWSSDFKCIWTIPVRLGFLCLCVRQLVHKNLKEGYSCLQQKHG